ncbi:hypothetical protein INH39_27605 [Massilia violaceinigra]|uniref:Uncharacterized protein n=1 Tax=Massilia violaceinigra TaxID=2045208 RepID=A0ABY4A657_9BURK|nr:hypothetical protein [Massilia violaceinigra]UOD29144.1 hypothetical protein INH39_27605 [Massilia violaceinigra]
MASRSGTYFVNTAVSSEEIGRALIAKFGAILTDIESAYLNPENTQRFSHGGPLRRPSATNFFNGGTKKHSVIYEVKFQDIVEHNVSILRLQIESFTTAMQTQFVHSLYTVIGESCDSIGNVVNAEVEGSTLKALEAVWEKLEIQVAADGTPKLPEMHCGSEAYEKFKEAIDGMSPEDEARMERVKARKIAEGREREVLRQARFIGYGIKT